MFKQKNATGKLSKNLFSSLCFMIGLMQYIEKGCVAGLIGFSRNNDAISQVRTDFHLIWSLYTYTMECEVVVTPGYSVRLGLIMGSCNTFLRWTHSGDVMTPNLATLVAIFVIFLHKLALCFT